MTHIWEQELAESGIRFLSLDPGDMDTALHAAAVPDADRSALKRPEVAAREIVDAIAARLPTAALYEIDTTTDTPWQGTYDRSR
jgi:NAD(P)-dependent dehydrogenase (short-subunit alcohol dehydrogenase family)